MQRMSQFNSTMSQGSKNIVKMNMLSGEYNDQRKHRFIYYLTSFSFLNKILTIFLCEMN